MSNRSLTQLAQAGYVVDEWSRWQQGECEVYAIALIRAFPDLRFATLTNEDRQAHYVAHDDTHAYDSAGSHPLPYRGVHDDLPIAHLDDDPEDYFGDIGDYSDEELADAAAHFTRHGIGPTAG